MTPSDNSTATLDVSRSNLVDDQAFRWLSELRFWPALVATLFGGPAIFDIIVTASGSPIHPFLKVITEPYQRLLSVVSLLQPVFDMLVGWIARLIGLPLKLDPIWRHGLLIATMGIGSLFRVLWRSGCQRCAITTGAMMLPVGVALAAFCGLIESILSVIEKPTSNAYILVPMALFSIVMVFTVIAIQSRSEECCPAFGSSREEAWPKSLFFFPFLIVLMCSLVLLFWTDEIAVLVLCFLGWVIATLPFADGRLSYARLAATMTGGQLLGYGFVIANTILNQIAPSGAG
jgi:hypothetical protein